MSKVKHHSKTVDTTDDRENLVQLTTMFTSFQNRKMSSSVISSELTETSGTYCSYTHPPSREIWLQVIFMEELQPKTNTSDKVTQLCTKTQELGAEKWQQLFWTDESTFEIFGCSRKRFVH